MRPKAGIYKHDLAKVIEADPSNQVSRGEAQCVPRGSLGTCTVRN